MKEKEELKFTPASKLLSEKEKEYFKLMVKENASTKKITKKLYDKLKNKNSNLKITKKAIKYLLDKLNEESGGKGDKTLNEVFNSLGLSEKELEYFKKIIKKNISTKKITEKLYEKLKNKKPKRIRLTKKAIKYLLDKLRDKLKNGNNGTLNMIFNSLSFERVEKCHYCNGELITTGVMKLYGSLHTRTTYYYCLNCGKSHSYNLRSKDVTKKIKDVFFVGCWPD